MKPSKAIIPDNLKEKKTDYTRCAAYQRYRIPVDYKKTDFIPTPPVTPAPLVEKFVLAIRADKHFNSLSENVD